MANAANTQVKSFWDRAAEKQEESMEKVGYKFSKEEMEERDKIKTTHDTMAGSTNAPEFEHDGNAAVRVPEWLGKTGMFDASDMNYTKNQLAADNERARNARQKDNDEVRAFKQAASTVVEPEIKIARPNKQKAPAPAPAAVVKKKRKISEATKTKPPSPAPSPAENPLGLLAGYGSGSDDSE